MPWVPAAIGAAGAIIGGIASRGGSSDVDYEWSPEQEQSWKAGYPFMAGVAQYGQQNLGQPYMGAPMMGAPPSIYNVPNTQGLMPNQGWYDNLDSGIKQGMWEPWNDAANQLQMNMGGQGQLGAPGAGYSGAAGTALGQLYADAGQQVGQQAWNMVSPIQQMGWQANLGQNIQEYQTSLTPWQENYQTEKQAWQMPFALTPGMVTGNYPTGIISQQGNPWAGALSGAAQGAMYGNAMYGGQQQQPYQNFGSSNPYNIGMYGGGYTGNPYNIGQYGTTAYGM